MGNHAGTLGQPSRVPLTFMFMQLSFAIEEFLMESKVFKNLSKNTIRNQEYYLQTFVSYLDPEFDVRILTKTIINKFRMFLHASKLSIETQHQHLVALRCFLRFLKNKGIDVLDYTYIDLPKLPDREMILLEHAELVSMKQSVDMRAANALRDLAMLHFLYSTGVRVSELCGMNRSDVNVYRRDMRVIGKGLKARMVFLSETAAQHLKNYLNSRDDNLSPLFLLQAVERSERDNELYRMTVTQTERTVLHIARAAGLIKRVTPHMIRHTFATELLRNGADIRSVQELLGHAYVTTTQMYTHVSNNWLKEVHAKYHR